MKCCAAAGLLMTALLISGCGEKAPISPPPPLVKYQKISLGASSMDLVYAGTVKGRYETNLSFQVGGKILSRNVQLGDRVTSGDVLMTIDAKDIAERARQGDAAEAAALAELNLAAANLRRFRELYAAEAVSAATLDQYQTNYDAAMASYQNAAAEATKGHNALSYTMLLAGSDGVISEVSAEAGQVVAAGQTVMTLTRTEELEVEINVPENHLADVQIGKTAKVSLWALGEGGDEPLNDSSGSRDTDAPRSGWPVSGEVREVSPMADSVSRTYRVRVAIPSPPPGMGLGMTASVSLESAASSRAASILPLSAIYQTGEKPMVWVVDGEGRVRLREVVVADFRGNRVLITGLFDGDIVVTAGVHRLHEGDEVRLGTEESRP